MADDEMRKIFAQNLNRYLEMNGYNQADLARYMKVSTATTAKWCTAQTLPRIDKVQSICNWFGIKKTDLLDKPSDDDHTKLIQLFDGLNSQGKAEVFNHLDYLLSQDRFTKVTELSRA